MVGAVATPKHVALGQLTVTSRGTFVVTGYGTEDSTLVRLWSPDGTTWSDPTAIGTNIGQTVTPVSKTSSPPMNSLATWQRNVYCAYPAERATSTDSRIRSSPARACGRHAFTPPAWRGAAH